MSSRAGERLGVFLGAERMGELERRGPARYRFEYEPTAIDAHGKGSVALSASLPLRAEAFAPRESAPFFEGLLPEGTIRATIAGSLRLSEEDGFGLLAALGGECAGAVSVLPPGGSPVPAGGGRFERLEWSRLAKLIEELPRKPLGVDARADGVRLSLGGVQHKLVLFRERPRGGQFPPSPISQFSLPLDGAASNCILKPEFDVYEDLVANEYFCMLVAGGVGLGVARVDTLAIGGTACICVERFDRLVDELGRVSRIHQEDLCQAMGLLPSAKYEENGGPSIVGVVDLLRALRGPFMARDINDFIHAVMVNFLLGNSDAHGKNFALLHTGEGPRMAPLYDIVSTSVYPELTDRLAMSIGGVDDPRGVDLDAWARLSQECGFGGGIAPIIRQRAKNVIRSVETHRELALGSGWHRPVIDKIADLCRERAAALV